MKKGRKKWLIAVPAVAAATLPVAAATGLLPPDVVPPLGGLLDALARLLFAL